MIDHRHIKTLITSGCSFTAGSNTWPNCLAEQLDCDLINLGVGGAGNDYISASVIDLLESQDFDPGHTMIAVMWSGIGRKDFCVSGEYWYWLDDYAYKSHSNSFEDTYWVHSGGLSGWQLHPGSRETFAAYYKFTDPLVLCKDSLCNMSRLTDYLQNKQYHYRFMSYQNYWRTDSQSSSNGDYTLGWFAQDIPLYQNLDFDRWIFVDDDKNSIFEFCRDSGLLSDDRFHPTRDGHRAWVEKVMLPKLSEVVS